MTIEDRRLKLHEILCDILGSRHVYYDPPESIRMKYPAIVYRLGSVDTVKADNTRYLRYALYNVTYIRKDDDDDILDKLLDLPLAAFGTSFTADNLHHDTLSIYV